MAAPPVDAGRGGDTSMAPGLLIGLEVLDGSRQPHPIACPSHTKKPTRAMG